MPLILVQNEVTVGGRYDHWQDNEGVLYHYPNKYVNKINEGEPFIYYKGRLRLNKRTAIPEYFGFGKIGKTYIDPTTSNGKPKDYQWFCEILDYIPFLKPVPFKIDGIHFENIPDNLWRDGVRNISDKTFRSILAKALIPFVGDEPIVTSTSPIIPKINEINPLIVGDHQKLFVSSISQKLANSEKDSQDSKSSRRSKYAKLYGDHSEEIVYKVLTQNNCYELKWNAKEKEKPGWDIQYFDEKRNLVAVEVKGTSGKRFLNVEVTSREWEAAERVGNHYNLYLVADCLSTVPKIQVINNPYSLYQNNQLLVEPLVYRLRMIS
ncbi:MAG: DUF3883 domain-containing protein [Bacteroidetes bacterium]|nr:MAG: DUF3883 domain-containing protein [Bacteroidota bacterium]